MRKLGFFIMIWGTIACILFPPYSTSSAYSYYSYEGYAFILSSYMTQDGVANVISTINLQRLLTTLFVVNLIGTCFILIGILTTLFVVNLIGTCFILIGIKLENKRFIKEIKLAAKQSKTDLNNNK